MSHWLQGKMVNLKCSLAKLREAIINIMPEWEGHMEISQDGSLAIHSSHTGETKTGYHIRVPENSTLGIRYCDFGVKQLSDGTWHIQYDSGGLPTAIRNAPGALKDEVSAMRTKEIAKQNGIQVMEEDKSRNGIRQRLRMTPDQIENFVQQL